MNNYLKKLEYNKITEKLSSYAITYLGKNKCINLLPSNIPNIVNQTLKETDEASILIYKNNNPPLNEIANNNLNIKILESNGTLSIKALLDLVNIFTLSESLKKYFFTDFIKTNDFPYLNALFEKLYYNPSIIATITNSILDENTISNNASKKLYDIRKKQNNIEEKIKSTLNTFIHSSKYSKYIQDSVITIRNNRFVIPVKEEYKSQIKGFIHDTSSSGSTVFIEPISIFDFNNEISNLKIEENIEIEKILANLSQLFYPYIEDIKNNIDIIGKIDFTFAKAKYSRDINGITPKINSKKEIYFKNARHPLLDKNSVVPISLTLGKDYNTLVITGPNTGGKTVSLKTIGLLCAMGCSGLNIPADENSSIYIFDNIFVDIGDNQSISNSLSTFSSHITNIVDILNHSTENSLVLIDELGSGTDPLEGAALAISILNYFKEKKCLTVSTTHYQELKKFALSENGFENASVEFDINTLSPTYRLLIGVPGKSNAFEISNKLGIPHIIIENARRLINKNDIDIEDLLKKIYDNKIQIEKEKLELSNELNTVSNLRKSLEQSKSKLIEDEQNIINTAKTNAKNILLDAKDTADKIIYDLNHNFSDSSVNNVRNTLNKEIKNLSSISLLTNNNIVKNPISIDEAKPNVDVFITTLNKSGTIVSHISKSNEVQVQVGNIKMNINVKYLEKLDNKANKNTSSVSFKGFSKSKSATSEINVIGLNVDEAVYLIDKFLDDCYIAKLNTVRIIHGKGSGKLREGIHSFLKHHSHVLSFRIGSFGEGEMGVTVVEIG